MKIKDKFKEKMPLISFEIFPPKQDTSIETIFRLCAGNTIGRLKCFNDKNRKKYGIYNRSIKKRVSRYKSHGWRSCRYIQRILRSFGDGSF